MKIVLSETLSYCVGVRNTLELTERLLAENPDRSYCMLGEIVHNERVIEALKARGLRVVRTLDEVPAGGVVILQSHGSPLRRYRELKESGIAYVDATCPMVRVIHKQVREIEAEGRTPVVIGRVGHEEIRGIVGQVRRAIVVKDPDEVTPDRFRGVRRAGVVVQSTFIAKEALRVLERIRQVVPDVVFHDTICHPTKARQRQVEIHSARADRVIIIGSRRSANTMHLYDIARALNPRTSLVDSPEGVEAVDVPAEGIVFIASGASTPEDLILEVVRRLEARASSPGRRDPAAPRRAPRKPARTSRKGRKEP